MKCEYVCGTNRKSAKGEKGTAHGETKAILQMNLCGTETDNLMYDIMKNKDIPICEEHAVFSLPPSQWK